MGAAACYYLSKQGYKVLGIEQFDITHELGSHTGQSRLIRKAYFEHPDYVPLLNNAYHNWKELETETGEEVYFQTGLLYFGKPGNEMMEGVRSSASLFNIPLDDLNVTIVRKKFPQFHIENDLETLFEPEAGFLIPEKTIKLFTQQAIKKGAVIHTNEKVAEWKKEGSNIVVTTDKNIYRCHKLIICAGAWARKLIPQFQQTITITRQFIAWMKPVNPEIFELNNFPCWLLADNELPGCFYGFPVLPKEKFGEPHGLKIAYHHPGITTDPDKVNREVLKEDIDIIKYATEKYFPGKIESIAASKTCLYSYTPDEDFIIDKLPKFEDNVVIACGFSGHGFKFASVVGEILAELATEGKTKLPINFLSAKRFAK
jgi:sarcosine oxidase